MNISNRLKLFDEIYKKNDQLESFFISYLSQNKVRKHSSVKLNNEEVVSLKNSVGTSFWQSALSMYHEIILNDEELVNEVTFHNGSGLDSIEIFGGDLYKKLKSIVEIKEELQTINMLSRVRLRNGDFGYLPIIDFRLKQSKSNFNSASHICDIIGPKLGFKLHLFESSTSYHAYGDRILKFNEYFSFLGWAMLFDPIVDGRHIAHQLIDGYGALRIA